VVVDCGLAFARGGKTLPGLFRAQLRRRLGSLGGGRLVPAVLLLPTAGVSLVRMGDGSAAPATPARGPASSRPSPPAGPVAAPEPRSASGSWGNNADIASAWGALVGC